MMANMSVVPGSIGQVAHRAGQSLAEGLLDAEIMILVDVSGSMNTQDSRGGRSRYAVACEELAKLQAMHPGKIAVVAFSSAVRFAPSGVPEFEGQSTDLAAALRFALPWDGTVRFVVVSDGVPDSEADALAVARQFTSWIDTVFVGPEGDYGGRAFLERLARASGRQSVTADRAAELAARVETLLIGGKQ